jgi:hypothetical protein
VGEEPLQGFHPVPAHPSRVAFTILACSRLTFRSYLDQASRSHSGLVSKDAHADCSVFICDFLLWLVLPALS